ncbi:MAG: lysophospholipid acyltransferase family protein [Verrucomicrobiota bacterium]
MDAIFYLIARSAVALLQALPLLWVARLGRMLGAIAYWLDARHRRVVVSNLTMCFGKEKSAAAIRALARENFKRLGENFASAVKTAAMSAEELQPFFSFIGVEKVLPNGTLINDQNRIFAIGHFGNFELYARFAQYMPGAKCATTYRGLRQPSLNRLMQSLRERSPCQFYERRTDSAALKAALSGTGLMLGLLADQHAGRSGVRLPFLGHECSTSTAPAVLALRYNCRLYTSICYRVALGHWQIEAGEEIPTHENGKPRSTEAIMLDVNRAFEKGLLRDPANWFWVHNRWKPLKPRADKRKRRARNVPADEPEVI